MKNKPNIDPDRLKPLQDVLILLIVLMLLGLLLTTLPTFESVTDARDYIEGFGMLAPLIIILLIVLEVIIAPIPGAVLALTAGALYGTVLGTIYSYIGNIIGTTIAFFLAKRFGRPLVERIVKSDKLDAYDCFFREHGKYGLWVVFLFPVFPTDIVAFVSGLSKIRFRTFISIVAIAYIPNMLLLNAFGDQIFRYGIGTSSIIIGSLLLFVFLFALFLYAYLKKNSRCNIE